VINDKLPLHTPDLTNKNYIALAALFPNAVTETIDGNGNVVRTIDADVLAQEINTHVVSGKEERYQFTWPDKKKAVLMANSPIAATLRPCREESVNFDNTENLYIEGDNLDVLKLLRETYLNRVKMIYIDPPYNTGNDFIYDDDFTEDTSEFLVRDNQYDEDGNRMIRNLDSNGRFHTDWLNMIYPRLRIARDLLADDGVIFISIDDGEIENFKKTCNEIFGVDSFIECVVWKNKYGAGAKTVGFISAHEYILCYGKKPVNNVTCDFEGEEREKYSKRDEKYNTRGPYRTQPLMTNSLGDRPNLMYPIEYNGTKIFPHKQWVWSKERMMKAIEDNNVELSLQNDGTYSVRSKAYLYDENGNMRRGKPVSVLNGPFTQDGTKEVRSLFDDRIIFDFSKPSKLIEYFLKLQINDDSENDSIILDFFSGSATTAHAVMQLNAEDGGKRKFIMVQLSEVCAEDSEAAKAGYKNICEIGKERIRRAGKKIVNESPLDRAELDIGFRVLKLDSSNMKDVYYTPQDTVSEIGELAVDLNGFIDNIKPDRTAEDLLFQVMLDLGIPLSAKIKIETLSKQPVYFVNPTTSTHSPLATSNSILTNNYLIACFDRVTDEIVTEIAKNKPYYAVFRDSSFYSDVTLVNFEQIFKTYSPTTIRKVL
jgi:adenine-specific DNA-methyltransferase